MSSETQTMTTPEIIDNQTNLPTNQIEIPTIQPVPIPPVDDTTIPTIVEQSEITNASQSFESMLFNKRNLSLLVFFVIVYIVSYYLLGKFYNKPSSENTGISLTLSRILDVIVLIAVFSYLVIYFFATSMEENQTNMKNIYNESVEYVQSPFSLLTTALFLFVFYLSVYLFRIPMTSETKPTTVSFIENITWLAFVINVFVVFFKYVLGISFDDILQSLRLNVEKEVPVPEPELPVSVDEVFNVSNNLYAYDDAQAVCSALGAKLATYDQVEESYNNGGEWCNYGWSEGQMALFPTQKETWNKLQETPEYKNNCGRPGVNGGFIGNPNVKFGINCFGKKPEPTQQDKDRLMMKQTNIFPQSQKDKELEEKIQYWKDNASELLKLNSFSRNTWSKY